MSKLITSLLVIPAALVLLMSFMIPTHLQPWIAGYNEIAAFFSMLLISVFLFNKPIAVPRATILIALTALIPILQWKFGVIFFSEDAVIVASYLLGFASVVLIGFNFSTSYNRTLTYNIFFSVFIIGAILSTWIALRQWLFLQDAPNSLETYIGTTTGLRPFANFAQPNSLATFLCMGLASTLYFFEQRRFGVLTSSLLAIFLILGVAITQSRTPWVGVLFAIGWWAWKSRIIQSRLSRWGFASWSALYFLFVFITVKLSTSMGLIKINVIDHAQHDYRFDLFQQFGSAVLHGSLWGFGWNQGTVAQLSVPNMLRVHAAYDSSHNLLLDLLVWNGPILGSVLIIGFVTWMLRLFYKANSIESVLALMAVGFVLVHAMVEFPLSYAFFLLPVGFLIGMVEGEQNKINSNRLTALIPSHLTLPHAVFAVFLVSATVLLMRIEHEYSTMDYDFPYLDLSKKLQTEYVTQIPDKANNAIILTRLRESLRVKFSEPAMNMTAEQIDLTRKVAYRSPNAANLYHYTLALALNNQPELAKQQLIHIKDLSKEKVYNELAHEVELRQQQLAEMKTQSTGK